MEFISHLKTNRIIVLLFICILGFQIFLGYIFIREFILSQTKKQLNEFTHRVVSDLSYKNGTFDTSLYTADPKTPHPNGSSGFTSPLYIITTNGFVIERTHPINGFLDASDYKKSLSFS